MPSVSGKQASFMAACAHGAKLDVPCPPPKVAKEFNKADAGTGILKRKKTKRQKVKHRDKTFTMRN